MPVAEERRLSFYGILSTITSDDPETVRTRLGSVEPGALPPEDRDLLAAGGTDAPTPKEMPADAVGMPR